MYITYIYIYIKREKIISIGKTILSQAAWFIFVFYVGWTYILRGSLFVKVLSQLI